MPNLLFQDLHERHIGLTKTVSNDYAEAARVCLDRHHTSTVQLTISDKNENVPVTLSWIAEDQRTRDARRNEIDTTEAGAYAVALASVEHARGLIAVSRAETMTGADYYLDLAGKPIEDVEESYRLEISGINIGTASDLNYRLKKKIKQAIDGSSNLPALACIVGFSELLVLISDAVEP